MDVVIKEQKYHHAMQQFQNIFLFSGIYNIVLPLLNNISVLNVVLSTSIKSASNSDCGRSNGL